MSWRTGCQTGYKLWYIALGENACVTVCQTWPKGSDHSGGGYHFGTFLLLWRSGGTCTPTLLAPRGWHRLAIAISCCNDHTLTGCTWARKWLFSMRCQGPPFFHSGFKKWQRRFEIVEVVRVCVQYWVGSSLRQNCGGR